MSELRPSVPQPLAPRAKAPKQHKETILDEPGYRRGFPPPPYRFAWLGNGGSVADPVLDFEDPGKVLWPCLAPSELTCVICG